MLASLSKLIGGPPRTTPGLTRGSRRRAAVPHPSFADFLPWVDYLPEEQSLLLEDNVSRGAVYELTPTATEGRNADFSRMTIGLSGDPKGLQQIIMQVNKLIDVIHCAEHDATDAVVKELVLVKFLANDDQRTQALQIIEHFDGKTVDLTPTSMIALITGNSNEIDAAVTMLSKFQIIETVRTGKVVMATGEQPT